MTYIVANDWLFWGHSAEEAIHRLLKLCLIMRYTGLDMESVQGHSELLAEPPKPGKADGTRIEVVVSIYSDAN